MASIEKIKDDIKLIEQHLAALAEEEREARQRLDELTKAANEAQTEELGATVSAEQRLSTTKDEAAVAQSHIKSCIVLYGLIQIHNAAASEVCRLRAEIQQAAGQIPPSAIAVAEGWVVPTLSAPGIRAGVFAFEEKALTIPLPEIAKEV